MDNMWEHNQIAILKKYSKFKDRLPKKSSNIGIIKMPIIVTGVFNNKMLQDFDTFYGYPILENQYLIYINKNYALNNYPKKYKEIDQAIAIYKTLPNKSKLFEPNEYNSFYYNGFTYFVLFDTKLINIVTALKKSTINFPFSTEVTIDLSNKNNEVEEVKRSSILNDIASIKNEKMKKLKLLKKLRK